MVWMCACDELSLAAAVPALQTWTGVKKKGAGPQQYVEGLNGETACRSHVSALAAEAFMSNAG